MNKLRCLIVEDEPIAAEVLQDYISQVPHLDLVGICADAIYALETLQQQQVDVIFLDIHLPKLKGLDFIKTLKNPPQIILTTAYHQYALQGYELDVVDYLLKPIEFSRFLKAVNKLKTEEVKHQPPVIPVETSRPFAFFTVNKQKVKVFFDEIIYIESLKEYVRIHTPTQQLVTLSQMGEMEQLLPARDFLRIHRSYLISRAKVEAYSASEIIVGGIALPIGRSYKEWTLKALEGK